MFIKLFYEDAAELQRLTHQISILQWQGELQSTVDFAVLQTKMLLCLSESLEANPADPGPVTLPREDVRVMTVVIDGAIYF